MRSRAMRLIGAVPLLLGAATFGDLPREAFAQSREGFVPSRDGVELYYRIAGSGGDTLVVVHGGPGLDQGYLAPDLEYLGEAFTLIFYDQRGAGRSTLISDSAHIHLDAHVADLEHLRRYFGIERIQNGRAVNRLTWQSIGEWDWRGAFGDIEAPVLVNHGAGDPMPLASAHEWAHAFPDSRLVVFEGVGHYPHLERPQEFLRTLQEFLQGHRRPAAPAP